MARSSRCAIDPGRPRPHCLPRRDNRRRNRRRPGSGRVSAARRRRRRRSGTIRRRPGRALARTASRFRIPGIDPRWRHGDMARSGLAGRQAGDQLYAAWNRALRHTQGTLRAQRAFPLVRLSRASHSLDPATDHALNRPSAPGFLKCVATVRVFLRRSEPEDTGAVLQIQQQAGHALPGGTVGQLL